MATDAEIKAIIAEHETALTALPHVVGLGIVSEAEGPAVAVYVDVKKPVSQLRTQDIVPPTLASVIDGRRVDVRTRVVEVGKITF